jgi:glycine/D-amino acid oxidase-like deaminating enzyme
LEDFPIWAWIQAAEPNLTYGLPELHPTWMKVARHLTSGPDASPEREKATVDLDSEPFLLDWLSTHFPDYEIVLASTERCVYTMTPDERFVLQTHPESERVVLGGGFSGHGFKFGPLSGRILAELALWGECRSVVLP